VPLLVVLGFVILAALSIALDQSHASWLTGPRHALGHVVGKQAASTALSDIATGLVTVTSITFSVLLLAVQQTAANLSPVVFEQSMRRRSNQVYLGFFVGLCVYSYVVLAAVQKDTPPTLGAAVAVLLTVVALLILLTLVYSTLNQMRPVHVVFAIRTRALNARARELELIRRTRRAPQLTGPPGATAFSAEDGHVTAIQLEALDDRLRDQDTAEVELTVTLGQYVVAGEALAQIRGPNGDELAAVVREEVVVLGRQRDADQDATASVDQLANIAWTTGSTAKQSPEVARQALDALRGLLGRWTADLAAARRPNEYCPWSTRTTTACSWWTRCSRSQRSLTSRSSSRRPLGSWTPSRRSCRAVTSRRRTASRTVCAKRPRCSRRVRGCRSCDRPRPRRSRCSTASAVGSRRRRFGTPSARSTRHELR